MRGTALQVCISALKNGGLLRNSFAMPAWIFRRAKSLNLCRLQGVETEQVVSYPSEAQKCRSIVPRGTEKAGKKSLISYPLSVAIFMVIIYSIDY